MTFTVPKMKPINLDTVEGLEDKLKELLVNEEDSSYSSYSDDSDTSSMDSSDWDSDMEELEAGLNSLLGAAKYQSSPALSRAYVQKSSILRSESAMLTIDPLKQTPPKPKKGKSLELNPVEYLKIILDDLDGLTIDEIITSEDSFLSLDEQHLEGYAQVALAARQGNLAAMQSIHRSGTSLQCSNTYGESVQHIVCRRGYDKMLKYLLEEADTSLRIRDDVGRTPLHDAAWTNVPNFGLVKMVLANSPDLLFVKDKRGHLPLHYVHRDQWGPWCTFLKHNIPSIQAALESKYVTLR